MSVFSFIGKTKFFMSLPKYGALLFRLYADARVPTALKLAGIAAAGLIVSPLDPLADIPFLNVLDDAALLTLATQLFLLLAPAGVVAEHRAAVGLDRVANAGLMKNVTPR
ncbi:MAG TPA: hypothetical protein VEJ20_06940 [Candidatus Eremiobacteraceae bacterium]|nr:hypothetical protein [Candidatus Eremiobacteraceae bacterium]